MPSQGVCLHLPTRRSRIPYSRGGSSHSHASNMPRSKEEEEQRKHTACRNWLQCFLPSWYSY
jgi:hypothetical protein